MENLNLTNTSSDTLVVPVKIPRIFQKEVPILCFLIGTVLNLIIIIYFIKSKKYRSPIFTVLTSLAFMDIITCLFTAGSAAFLFPILLLPKVMFICPLFVFAWMASVYASVYHLVFFAALRLYQMAWPLSAMSKVTSQLMMKCCAGMIVVVSSFMVWYGSRYWNTPYIKNGKEVSLCIFHGDHEVKDTAAFIIGTVIPCVAILVLHVIKHGVVYYKGSIVSSELKQQRKNTDARVVTLVIIIFYICWLPQMLYTTLQQTKIKNFINTEDIIFTTLFYVKSLNSVINPILYCVAVKSVRDGILKYVCKKENKRRP